MGKISYTVYDCKCDSCEDLLSFTTGEITSESELEQGIIENKWKEYDEDTVLCDKCQSK